ncbi:unnamed protein product [Aspergillus oryzae]|uniref:Unnamed protein product n=1 Tax=Aspergillus oryzae TaxID=5062 RepID=A0AAN5BSW9_ASPOZ|nr:unnamed protein product [Aspergillus oryzae]GMG25053.1 unnamed protein product [Aspergillus oryzae]
MTLPADRAHTGGLDFPVGDVDFVGDVLLGESHVGGEGGVRLPLGRGPWRGLLHHLVDLLEGESLGLGDEEVGVEEGAGAEGSPDEEHLGLEIALVLVNHREDLADDNPGARTPGAGEEEDVNADERDLRADRSVVAALVTDDGTGNGDNKLADNHAQSTPQQQGTTSDLLHGVE